MNIYVAYEQVWAGLQALARKGIAFRITPSASRNNPETVERYKGQGLDPSRWSHITFYCDKPEDYVAIAEEMSRLSGMNIGFDMGGGSDVFDWEIDWSFKIMSHEEAEAKQITQEMVLDLMGVQK